MSYQQGGGSWPEQSWPSSSPYGDPSANPYADPSYQVSPGYAAPGSYPASGAPANPGAYPGYGYGYGQPVIAAAPPTNGLAVAALVCSLVGLVTCGLTSIIG